MKNNILVFILFLVFGCDAEDLPEEPLIQPEFNVLVSGQSWEPNRGGALILNNDLNGVISIRMAGPVDGKGRVFKLSIVNNDFEWLPVERYNISSLVFGFEENATYEQLDSDGELEQWRSERLNVAVIDISSITEVDGIQYLGGSFRASPCNDGLFPACIPISGTFDNLRLFASAEEMNLTIGIF